MSGTANDLGMSPSVYGAEQAMLDLADTFLVPASYSTLRAGFFGYMTGAMARATAEAAFHRNLLYKEQFLNTASLPESIYNYAKLYEYTVGLATPSQCRLLLGFYIDDIQTAMGSSTGTFVIPRGQPVFFGTVPFVVAGQVNLTLGGTDTGGNQIVSAAYEPTAMDFPAADLPNYIRSYILQQPTGVNGAQRAAVYLEVRVLQASPTITEFQVVQSSALETLFYDVSVPAGSELAGFSVEYLAPGATDYTPLPAFFNESVTPSVAQYCYYSFADDLTLEIFFSPLAGSFRPAYNTRLRVTTFLSLGSAGNFDFSGVVNVNLPPPFNAVPVLFDLVTQPTGGADKQTLKETKTAIQSIVLRRNSIVNESDLNSYLQDTVTSNTVNQSRVTFVKRRDDVISRLFVAFLTMFDSAGRIVPTNSAPLTLEIADLDSRGWSLKPGTVIIYDRVSQIYRLLAAGEFPDQMIGDANSFVYAIPYLLLFILAPFPRLVYYNNTADVDAALTSGPGDFVVGDSFLANSLTVRRNSVVDSTYQIDVALTTSLQSPADVAAKCLMRLRVFGPGSVEVGYAEMVNVAGTSIFRATLQTNDEFDENSQMIFPNSLLGIDDSYLPTASIPEGVTLVAELYYNSASPTTMGVRNIGRDGAVFQLIAVFTTVSPVDLYSSLEQVVSGEMHVTDTGLFVCNNVPLVGAGYFLNPRMGAGALAIASAYHDAITTAFDLLANNTSVDVKYASTYGPSKTYSVDRINLSLQLEVHPAIQASEALRQNIIAASASFVAACNDKVQGRFSVSNLFTYLETNVAGIGYIRFIGINGVGTQSTERILTDAQLQLNNNLVPEFLNVSTILSSSLAADPYVPDITVTFI